MIGMSENTRNVRLQAIINEMDSSLTNGRISFYNGARPVTGGLVTSLIGEVTLSNPSGSVYEGVLVFNLILDELSTNLTDNVTWARITNGNGDFVMDLDCGEDGSGAEIIFDTISCIAGGKISIISGLIIEGNI